MKIILDAMGGDFAPKEQVLGGCFAAEKLGVEIILVGDENQIKKEMELYNGDKSSVSIYHCSEKIENDDDPIRSVRKKKDSSVVVGMQLLKDGKGDAFVCSGNTGALIAAASLTLGRLEGIERPALTPILPTQKGPAALLDAGANSMCSPENLYYFAIMGSYYMQEVMNIKNPRVGLVNIGIEEHKGSKLTKEAFELLKKAPINFIGNIEARNIPYGDADVIVTDGFTGNVILKLTEGLGKFFTGEIKSIFLKNIKTKIASIFVKDGLKEFKNKLDYKEFGGAPLLGVDGIVIKAHGSSDSRAIYNAVRQAKKAVEANLTDVLKINLKVSGEENE